MKFQVFLFVTMATLPNRVVGVFTPIGRAALVNAVGTCLAETSNGGCPTFATSTSNGVMGEWDTAAVTDMSSLFTDASEFNADISKWNTAAVTDMSSLFTDASAFNADISKWNTAAVTDMSSLFTDASAFNADISKWNTAAVTDMNSMFKGAVVFNAEISAWDTAAVTDMNSMFTDAVEFNADISKWGTAAVTDMNSMFKGAVVFDADISKWGTDKVTNMNFELMFDGAVAFQAKYNCPNTGGIVLNTANSNCICGKYRCQQGKDRCFSCSSICFELIDDVSVAGTTPCVQSATKVIDNACQCKTDECDVGNFCYYNICSATGINNVDEFNDYLYNQRL